MLRLSLAGSFALLLSLVGIGWVGFGLASEPVVGEVAEPLPLHRDAVAADAPVAYWDFQRADHRGWSDASTTDAPEAVFQRNAFLGGDGPRPDRYPTFSADNLALRLTPSGGFLRVHDPGTGSSLDFDNGDAMTLEAWVNPQSVPDGQQVYIVGKGRTNNADWPRENQNYALRLRGVNGLACVSFLFRDADNRPGNQDDFHRWTSLDGFTVDGQWHHVALTYQFGEPDSIRAFVDGRESRGAWDMGGATREPPVVDNDQLWIGSSLGGSTNSSLLGGLDEVAIYRRALAADRLRARYEARLPDPREAEFAAAADLPIDRVVVELFEGNPKSDVWAFASGTPVAGYEQQTFALIDTPNKYTATGVIADRSNPFLVRARAKLTIGDAESGRYQFVLRARSGARLFVDGHVIAQTGMMSRNASGHEAVPQQQARQREDLRPLPPGLQEKQAAFELTAGEHVIRLEAVAGGVGVRRELGEVCVAVARDGQPFEILSAGGSPVAATEAAWQRHASQLSAAMRHVNADHRRAAAAAWTRYWDQRHADALKVIAEQTSVEPPVVPADFPVHNAIDRYVGARLVAAGAQPAPLTDDYEFLRRVSLDVLGIVPSPADIEALADDDRADRRERAIDRLLNDTRWACHWVAYWQDVLAENPGILKPELNNTGPFRWWIHESFLDNKPFDRFVTELVLMQGSSYYGGPAGFAMATQNDVPMAAKAHVLMQAFLSVELKCARCHDAPYHPFKQEQLFSLAAMLDGDPIRLPTSSTVPVAEGGRQPLVQISLKPGQTIEPAWPFDELSPANQIPDDLPDGIVSGPAGDGRSRLAAAITSPHNERFAQVIVNRLWHRYLGRGLVEPVDDWTDAGEASHPELLRYLARELVDSGYDLKHVARLILNSHTYQRRVWPADEDHPPPHLFASPARRRVTAEQLVDSLFAISGKDLHSEQLTLDPEGRRPANTFLNLGLPTRAWEFTSLSNERDRPALALPMAQSFIDLLLAYGWRDSRPNPVSIRDETATVLQPLTLANGVIGRRAVTLSDDHAVTALCLQDLSLETLIERIHRRVLSRPPTEEESAMFGELLADGYAQRVVAGAATSTDEPVRRNAVSWSNHLSAEATQIKLEMERAVQAGDPPTPRLDADWRERAEDMLWALVNSPEFVFVP